MSFIEDVFKGGAAGIFSGIAEVISKFKADPTVAANHAAKLAELEVALAQAQMQAEIALSQAQNKVNELQAASADKFNSRARPAVMWTCVFGLCYSVVLFPFLTWASLNFGWKLPPILDPTVLQTLLFGMLGFGAYRSFDKAKGTAS
jgi:hypothetical protein